MSKAQHELFKKWKINFIILDPRSKFWVTVWSVVKWVQALGNAEKILYRMYRTTKMQVGNVKVLVQPANEI